MQARFAAALCSCIAVASAGCVATSAKLQHVRVGMNRQDVVTVLGQPASTRAQSRTEYLTYYFNDRTGPGAGPYLVRLVDSRVESFGRMLRLADPPVSAGGNTATLNAVLPYPVETDEGAPADRVR